MRVILFVNLTQNSGERQNTRSWTSAWQHLRPATRIEKVQLLQEALVLCPTNREEIVAAGQVMLCEARRGMSSFPGSTILNGSVGGEVSGSGTFSTSEKLCERSQAVLARKTDKKGATRKYVVKLQSVFRVRKSCCPVIASTEAKKLRARGCARRGRSVRKFWQAKLPLLFRKIFARNSFCSTSDLEGCNGCSRAVRSCLPSTFSEAESSTSPSQRRGDRQGS